MHPPRLHVLLLLVLLLVNSCVSTEAKEGESLFSTSRDEREALHDLETLKANIQEEDVELSISRGWWQLAKALVKKSHDQGVDLSAAVRSAVSSMQREVDEVLRLLDRKHEEVTEISPAFRWAQSNTTIFLQVKFAYRWSSPGALAVDEPVVKLTPRSFELTAEGSHSREKKRYSLNLNFLHEIDVENSNWNRGSVGKFGATIPKATPGKWKRLLEDSRKISNMQVWWEMQDKFDHRPEKVDDSKARRKNGGGGASTDEEETNRPSSEPSEELQPKKEMKEEL